MDFSELSLESLYRDASHCVPLVEVVGQEVVESQFLRRLTFVGDATICPTIFGESKLSHIHES